MTDSRVEMTGFADSLAISGTLFLVGGSVAVIWPEPTLVPALLCVGLISTAAGFYQLSCGFAVRKTERTWSLMIAHGLLLLLFGLLTEGVTALHFIPALAVVTGWMLLYAIYSWAVALFVAQRRLTRNAATLWGAIHVFGALLVVIFSFGTMIGLLFLGAVYAATLGAWMILSGSWIRKMVMR